MNTGKRLFALLPLAVVVAIVVWIACCWQGLPVDMPCHFNPEGVASGTMSRSLLWWYPVAAAVWAALPYVAVRRRRTLWLHLSSTALAAIVLCSVGVALTRGQCPTLMYLEPVLLVAAIVCFVVAWKKKVRK